MTRASSSARTHIEGKIHEAIGQAAIAPATHYMDLEETSELDRTFLVERRLISRELANSEGQRSVVFEPDESTSIMINEEDHLRLQVFCPGFDIRQTWQTASEIDNRLEQHLDYSFHPKYGYLTACPTNVGTGMRLSIMLHLPGLVLSEEIGKVFSAVTKVNLAVRGLHGEGTQASGHFYQVSNQFTLGKSEEEVLDIILKFVPQILEYERRMRRTLLDQQKRRIENHIWRAFGLLANARLIGSIEAYDLLSSIRLGRHMGILPELDISVINGLFTLIQPAHIQKMVGCPLDAKERDASRATFLRKQIKTLTC
jgi:protein arginine kinase